MAHDRLKMLGVSLVLIVLTTLGFFNIQTWSDESRLSGPEDSNTVQYEPLKHVRCRDVTCRPLEQGVLNALNLPPMSYETLQSLYETQRYLDGLFSAPTRCGVGEKIIDVPQPTIGVNQPFDACAEARYSREVPPPDFIFVVGAGHSGTTLMRAVLSRHPQIWTWSMSKPEAHRWNTDRPNKIVNFEESSLFVRHGTDPLYLSKTLADWKSRAAAAAESINGTVLRILEKTPSHVCYLRAILNTVPNSRVLMMIRDGREVIASLAHRFSTEYHAAKGNKSDIQHIDASFVRRAIARWVNDNRAGLASTVLDKRVMLVRYEDLVTRGRQTILEKVLPFLSLDLTANPENLLDTMLLNERSESARSVEGAVQEDPTLGHILKRKYQVSKPLYTPPLKWYSLTEESRLLVKRSIAHLLLEMTCYLEPTKSSMNLSKARQVSTRPPRPPPSEMFLSRDMKLERHGMIISADTLHRDAPEILRSDIMALGGVSFSGYAVIRRPHWLEMPYDTPAGNLLLYFGHHNGRSIRLAVSSSLDSRWVIYPKPVLNMTTQTQCRKHVSSPDVHVDNAARMITMYFHGCKCPGDGDKQEKIGRRDLERPWDGQNANQRTYVAWSKNGIDFTAVPKLEDRQDPWASITHTGPSSVLLGTLPIGAPYFRVFWVRGTCYALGMPGLLYRSTDPWCHQGFKLGGQILPNDTRHHSVYVHPSYNFIEIFFTRTGQSPESILAVEINTEGDWSNWKPEGQAKVMLIPGTPYEGSTERGAISVRGQSIGFQRELRDPFVFVGGRKEGALLFYSAGGEASVAVARFVAV